MNRFNQKKLIILLPIPFLLFKPLMRLFQQINYVVWDIVKELSTYLQINSIASLFLIVILCFWFSQRT